MAEEIRLGGKDHLGVSLRERYEMGGQEPPEVPVPDAASHIWHWFWRLSSRRQPGLNSPSPITFPDVTSFESLTGEIIRPREVETIEEMDAAWLKAIGELQERNEERRKAHDQAKQKLRGK